MAKGFLDGCIWQAQSEGTGDFEFTEALESFFSPTEAGAVDGTTFNYTAYLGASREAGHGVWNESAGTLTRNPVISTNSNGLVNFADPPVIIMGGPLAQDMWPYELLGYWDFDDTSAAQVTVSNIDAFDSLLVRPLRVQMDTAAIESDDYAFSQWQLLNGSNDPLIGIEGNLSSYVGFASDFGTPTQTLYRGDIILAWSEINAIINIGGLFSETVVSAAVTDFSSLAESQDDSFTSSPETPVTFRLDALMWDNSASDYVANEFVGGKLWIYGRRN